MSFNPRTMKNVRDLPREECERVNVGHCVAGACPNFDTCGGKDNIHRTAAFYLPTEQPVMSFNVEDALIEAIDHGMNEDEIAELVLSAAM